MGAKAIYIDTVNEINTAITLNNDIEAIKLLLVDKEAYNKYSSGWRSVNLDEFIDQFTITDDKYNMTHNLRKISFWNDGKEYEIVCSVGARYFRILRQAYVDANGVRHGAENVGLDLKTPRLPKGLSGKAASKEFNRLTHFKMSYKKGTI